METYIGKTLSYPNFVETDKIIENTDKNNKYRYQLYIPFINCSNMNNNSLVIIMKNPSSANSYVCDMTIRKVCNVAYNNGYNSIIVANLFPMRATKATDLQYFYSDTDYNKIMDININQIKKLVINRDVIFAWGKDTIHGKKQFPFNYDDAINKLIKAVTETNCRIYFVDNCKCSERTCNADKQEKCALNSCYPLHGLRWSNNSKLIKY